MTIDMLEAVRLGDTTQWIRVRAANPSNPVLLLIQQGPGLPMINEVRRFERLLGFEKDFTVVYWDQRGCGRSLRGLSRSDGVTLDLMVSDTVSILEILRDRFDKKSYIAGFSLGATIGICATSRRPDLVETLVAVGADIDGVAAGSTAYDFALGTAHQRGNKRAIHQLEAIGPPPPPEHETVRDPGPLGLQLRRSHQQRDLRLGGPRTAGQPGALARLFGRRCAANDSRHHGHAGRTVGRDGDPGPRA
jgi:pimeloyl-ACP methyl ester carboxylesterase